ncbi:hypothetical protein QBC35DRAFT_277951 [Podospora australis]|uniref:Secreted protein n=1 Tax=Podospora australis TaxID=1536484 RepID=A0AAN6X486_9PEZI|nr:hypothetical protein QBC35DRAFT_277951 [Podospora australis]
MQASILGAYVLMMSYIWFSETAAEKCVEHICMYTSPYGCPMESRGLYDVPLIPGHPPSTGTGDTTPGIPPEVLEVDWEGVDGVPTVIPVAEVLVLVVAFCLGSSPEVSVPDGDACAVAIADCGLLFCLLLEAKPPATPPPIPPAIITTSTTMMIQNTVTDNPGIVFLGASSTVVVWCSVFSP